MPGRAIVPNEAAPHPILGSGINTLKILVVDDNRDQVFEFTNDGKSLVMTLGEAGVAAERVVDWVYLEARQ